MKQAILSHKTSEVAEAFNAISKVFDVTFENEITRRLRSKIYYEVEQLLPPGASILDINCGTGIDALHFAAQGYNTTGVDISEKMLKVAQRKVKTDNRPLCKFYQGSFEALPPDITGKYDMVFSNFGGLNCTNNLGTVAEELARVVKPSGFFVGIIMPPFSLWETCAYFLRGKIQQAFRRLNPQTQATGFSDKTFTVYYHSPAKIALALAPYLRVEQIVGLNIISPPPHAVRFSRRWPRLSDFLNRLDETIETLPIVRAAGDHYIVIAKKR
ncbi:MAG: methyltransferase domain-containing protein [Ignavibacteriales bacterium]|nr:methyltransferase domain-containing protein [Ignavibacteriales bacterium]